MKKAISTFSLIVFLFAFNLMQANSINNKTLDSLLNITNKTTNDSIKIECFIKLFNLFEESSYDTSLYYFNKAVEIIKKHVDIDSPENIKKTQKTKNYASLAAKCYKNFGFITRDKGNYDESINQFKKALDIQTVLGSENDMADCYNCIGIVYDRTGVYTQALIYYQKALKISEKLGDTFNIASTYNNIGSVHYHLNNDDQALEYYENAIEYMEALKDLAGVAACYINMGLIKSDKQDFDAAISCFQKSLKIYEDLGVIGNVAGCYVNMGIVARQQNDFEKAITYYNKAIEYAKQLGNKYHLAIVYGNVAYLKILQGKYNDALDNAEQSLEYAKDIGSLEDEKYAYKYMSDAYKGMANYKDALLYHKRYTVIKDSIISIEKNKQLSELETQYQTEKKEQQIKLQNTELAKQKEQIAREQAENEKKAAQRNIFIVGLVLMIILAFVVFRSYKRKKKDNALLILQKHEISEKNEELNQQNEEIASQRDEIEKQRDLLGEKNKQVTDSINYASRIQQAVMPSENILSTDIQESFIMLVPKDIVSGDFVWYQKIKEWLIVAVADCTGHGVPGAIMSMMGSTFLNEIVRKSEITHAGEVLDLLRTEVINALNKEVDISKTDDTVNDGMDIAFIAYNTENNILQYAGANNPIYIVREKGKEEFNFNGESRMISNDNFDLLEIKADSMPISIYRKMDNFRTNEIKLHKNDTIYMFSDGYADQFGGKDGRKFKYSAFKQLLLNNTTKTMKEQKEILINTFNNWKDGFNQIDDVLVIGIKI